MVGESLPYSERSAPTREEVIEQLKQFPSKGIIHPDDIRTDLPDGFEATRTFLRWIIYESNDLQVQDIEADLRFCLKADMLFVDAGFNHPDYLDEVAHEFLQHDLERAEEAGLVDIAEEFRRKIIEVESLIL